MAQFYESLSPALIKFIEKQPMFFTATGCAEGRINLSPKGMDSFQVLGPNSCGYIDLTGSGNETAAHIKNDGRLTFMFNSFGRQALILRLYGKGRVIRTHHAEFKELAQKFGERRGQRQLILMDIESVQTSCGWGVPQMEVVAERKAYQTFLDKHTDEEIEEEMLRDNAVSIDGLPTGISD